MKGEVKGGVRGDVKGDVKRAPSAETFLPLRAVEFHILLALAPGARHGYGILQDTLRRTEGQLLLEPGTLYRALRRLLADGLVEEGEPEGSRDRDDERRRYYHLTALGRQVAAAEVERMDALVAAARASGLVPAREPDRARPKDAADEVLPAWRLKVLRGEKP